MTFMTFGRGPDLYFVSHKPALKNVQRKGDGERARENALGVSLDYSWIKTQCWVWFRPVCRSRRKKFHGLQGDNDLTTLLYFLYRCSIRVRCLLQIPAFLEFSEDDIR